jgi:hypothetical protein
VAPFSGQYGKQAEALQVWKNVEKKESLILSEHGDIPLSECIGRNFRKKGSMRIIS